MIAYFTRHPTAANLLMLIIILGGILGMTGMNRAVFPEFDADIIKVQVVYKGATAEEVEENVCSIIEEAVEGIEGIERVTSAAREGLARVTIEVQDGAETAEVLDDVRDAVELITTLPDDAEDPVVAEVERKDNVIVLSLGGPDEMSEKDLLALAESVKDELLRLDEVSLVELQGFSEHRIRIAVRDRALRSFGLSIPSLAERIRNQSLDLPAGSVETDEREIKIRVVDQRRWAEEFRALPVVTDSTGAQVPLGNLAEITDTFEDEWSRARFNGKRAVNLQVNKSEDEDTLEVARAVRAYADAKRPTLPKGVVLHAWGDWSKPVKERLGMLVKNGCQGFVLVFLTLWFFLNLRLSFWVALGIPISFLGTLYVMDVSGMTLNMITMFSLILALGIIVDDAIIIGENVYTHYGKGINSSQAATRGAGEVAVGVISSMLTTVAIFLPLITMRGEIGKVLRVLPLGVIAALSVSLIEGFLIMPNHLSHSLRGGAPTPNRLRAGIDRGVKWCIQRLYGPTIDWCVRHRAVPIALIVALWLLSVGQIAGGRLNFTPFPKVDGDFLVAKILLPRGTDFDRTRDISDRVEGALAEVNRHFKPSQPRGTDLILHHSTHFGVELGTDEVGSHVATVTVELLGSETRTVKCDEILNHWRSTVGDVPDVVSLTFDQMQVTPGGKAIELQLVGADLKSLQKASWKIQDKIKTYPGVRNLSDDLRAGKEEVRVRLKDDARALDLTASSVARQLRASFWGDESQEFQRGSDNVTVEVVLNPKDRRSLTNLEEFEVRTPAGDAVAFHEVASVSLERGYSKIVRIDGRRTVTISADVDPAEGNATKIVDDLKGNFFPSFLEQHRAVSLNLEGQSKETGKTLESVVKGFSLGIILIFLLLSFVFRSYVEPLIVMAAIPFGLVGAIWGHILLGFDWTMPSLIGFVSLSGIVVNDSIVLVEFIKIRRREGLAPLAAIMEAGRNRFRAVFLTSATTVAGLLPLLAERSMQAQFLKPMAISIAFGLMFSTVTVLLMIPALYSVLSVLGLAEQPQKEAETPA